MALRAEVTSFFGRALVAGFAAAILTITILRSRAGEKKN
jgi:hypothetical protein